MLAASSSAGRSPSSTAAPRCGRSAPRSAASPTTRCRRRSTSTGSSGSSTTCSTTSTARRWRTRSRCACRSSTTTSSSTARRSRAELKVRRLNTKHVLKHAARGLVPDRIIDKPKVGFFNAAVDGWFRAQTRGAVSDYLLGPEPALRGVPRPRARSSGSSAGTPTARDGKQLRAPARDPDARGLALDVSAARALDRRRRRERAQPSPADRVLAYAVVTPARNEAENLPRLADALRRADRPPDGLDRSSTTARRTRRASVAAELAREHPWIRARRRSPATRARARRPDRARLRGRPRGARRSRPTSSSSSTPTSRSTPTTSSGCSRAFAADPRSGWRAARARVRATATGVSGT